MSATCQRWRSGQASYRPSSETIRARDYTVAGITSDREARAFVCEHHYSRSYPAARFRYGLYTRGALVGVAVFGVPAHPAVLGRAFPGMEASAAVELSRLILLDLVPGNGESWFVARCFQALRRRGIEGVLAHSDPVPRTRANGTEVKPGHVGIIYQALSAVYAGTSKRGLLRLLPDGTTLSPRALSKLRRGERGRAYVERLLLAYGAEPRGGDEEPAAWAQRWVPRLTRPLRHPGNHRYLWALSRAARAVLPEPQPYPRRTA